ncbi:hypothetical protein [Roseomonas sp. KE0001]|uniref:hypothetical protein n=1 Tax=Roseomonas sp. KE0001 TaxID=2479201 RepID=UPI0018DFC9D4|nr:hypothetical protein [Roseomonas sp. KE0001]
MKSEEQAQLLEQLSSAGVASVRMTLHEPFSAVIDAMRLAQLSRLDVVLDISLNIRSYFATDTRRRHQGKVDRSYPLSTLDVALFEKAFGPFWQELERRGIHVQALQVGNEINWSFNGDLRSGMHGEGQVYDSLRDLPNAAAFERGLDNYVAVVRFVHAARDASSVNRSATILSAGLARIRPDFARKTGADALDAGLTYRLLEQRGLSRHIDAAAIHYYPAVSATPEDRRRHLQAALAECGIPNARQACWITEWGISNSSQACPSDDNARARLVRETRAALREAADHGELAASYYFEWSGRSARSIWRCGGLTEAGRLAIAPLGARP